MTCKAGHRKALESRDLPDPKVALPLFDPESRPTEPQLLARDEFRTAVFARDGRRCVICGKPSTSADDAFGELDAHHITERRLWDDGGYYLDNGASLCSICHMRAERTEITCEEIRSAAGITRVLLPPHLYEDYDYDKWGNIILVNGQRLRGELYFDESVQKVIPSDMFSPYVKHPRTHHLPGSGGLQDESERMIPDLRLLLADEVVVTEKLDGEQTTMYRDHIHARSLEMLSGPLSALVKVIWGRIAYEIPPGWRVSGENMYATHSIHYTNLESWFYVFGIWTERNECLSWDETKEWCQLFGIPTVPEIYRGPFDQTTIDTGYQDYRKISLNEVEGYVVRLTRAFGHGEHRRAVAKWVRPGHVQTDRHWRHQRILPNELKN